MPYKPVLTRIFTTPRTSSSDNKVLELATTGVLDMPQEKVFKRRSSI
jgi:hypothetical protein